MKNIKNILEDISSLSNFCENSSLYALALKENKNSDSGYEKLWIKQINRIELMQSTNEFCFFISDESKNALSIRQLLEEVKKTPDHQDAALCISETAEVDGYRVRIDMLDEVAMSLLFCSPGRYIQGAGAIKEIGGHALRLGSSALLVGGKTALSLAGPEIEASLAEKNVVCHQECFGGTSSQSEVDRLVAIGVAKGADIVIAVGGGAAIDAGKAVSHELRTPVIVVPTTVATDAPCSALSVIYTDAGVFERYLLLRRNPDCILVDTALIAQSPVRFLVAGMGDALATFWESDTCARSGRTNPLTGGGSQTLATRALARLCYETLLESGVQAKVAVARGVVTPAVEAIVEANTLLSGLSSENGGHAGGHAVHNGLTTLAATKNKLHGEKVAFGVLVQLVLEGRPQQAISEVQGFCHSVGLPLCLADLDLLAPTRAEIQQVATAAVAAGETMHATWFPVTAAMVESAVWTADALGVQYREAVRSTSGLYTNSLQTGSG